MRVIAIGLGAMLLADLAFAATPHTVELQVKNMTCAACSITIEKALEKVDGVSRQRIDTEAGTATFDAAASAAGSSSGWLILAQ